MKLGIFIQHHKVTVWDVDKDWIESIGQFGGMLPFLTIVSSDLWMWHVYPFLWGFFDFFWESSLVFSVKVLHFLTKCHFYIFLLRRLKLTTKSDDLLSWSARKILNCHLWENFWNMFSHLLQELFTEPLCKEVWWEFLIFRLLGEFCFSTPYGMLTSLSA